MADDSIVKKVVKGLGEIGTETGKELIKQVEKVTESVITGQELLGIKPLSEEELSKKKAEDGRKKQEEMDRIRAEFGGRGRNVEEEIRQVREEKEREEQEKEKQSAEEAGQQQVMQEESQQPVEAPGVSKKQAAKTQFVPGKKRKSQQPDPTQMSQTSEFKGGKID